MYVDCFCLSGEIGFMNCDGINMNVVNMQFELLEYVYDSVYVDMHLMRFLSLLLLGLCVCLVSVVI